MCFWNTFWRCDIYVLFYSFLFWMVFMQFVGSPFELHREHIFSLLVRIEVLNCLFFILNDVYAVSWSTFWIAERACFLCWSCPGGWCCHSICPQDHLQSTVRVSKIIKAIKVFQHNQSICAQDLFKAIKVFKNNQSISSPHQCQGW